jgi:hypothetical protein
LDGQTFEVWISFKDDFEDLEECLLDWGGGCDEVDPGKDFV